MFQSDFDPTIFAMNIIAITCSMIWPWSFCYFANLATDRLLKIDNTIYGLNWFDYPVKMQKYVILMIAQAHEQIHFSGLGMIPCTLESFGKVCGQIDIILHRFIVSRNVVSIFF